ncbi:conserved hypothetical protein [Talaromyces stipitatus ATCC 10500]|uniref:DUF676 domain-containing protein n=1 Tax=Talaromyces stipitatus (strain ATCC 10500 / CBS 375.48 / QM 6759 / NRRL 1006) TaxID=441959 RepID=B8M6U5_TALSN|nr:uncharacterized protein TSTA_034040 [Talaromyces stipitatus ATCC 10500]EED20165.1 conserved hypothetical protein [Talaromyces stipitatus ATCC 10500]
MIVHPPVQLDDSVDSTNNQDASLCMTLSNISSTENTSGDRYASSAQRPPPLPLRKDASSSTISLGPPGDPRDGRRRLLLIYIHGFMGAEDSFRKFPAHVHNLVANALAESHVVYSKIYPRYKSRRPMSAARDEFSSWLSPHESDQTDVILLGHSLGGILAAEVAQAGSENESSPSRYRHRLLGTLNFDVPFLGMHPSVVSTGLSSLFNPRRIEDPSQEDLNRTTSPKTTDSLPSDQSSQYSTESTASSWYEQIPDSNFDPPFVNDVHRVKRNQLDGAMNFLKKNSGNLRTAVKEYASSYFEFGGCLADYSGLRRRYALLKELDGIDDLKPKVDKHGRLQKRVRFVNYYTASSGFPKKSPSESLQVRNSTDGSPSSRALATGSLENLTKLPSPILSGDNDTDEHLTEVEPSPMQESPSPKWSFETLPEHLSPNADYEDNADNKNYTSVLESLPPLPTIPPKPSIFDPSKYTNKEVFKQAQKEHERLVKLHERAQKELDTTIKEREKLVQKLNENKQKPETVSLRSQSRGDLDNSIIPYNENDDIEDRQPPSTSTSIREESLSSMVPSETTKTDTNPISPSYIHEPTSSSSLTQSTSTKLPKDRLFCALPPSPVDPQWVRIFMPDVDQVVAHQSIFLPNGLYYEWLVNDTAARIEQWVQDDCTRRAIWEQFGEIS